MVCPACGVEIPEGIQWCNQCYTNVINPEIGRLASVDRRLGAVILDNIVAYLVVVFCGFLLIVSNSTEFFLTACFVLDFGLCSIFYLNGTTPGKAILGLYVVKKDGQKAGFGTMVVREWILKLISAYFLFLGFLWALFNRERRTWHDMILGTYVVVQPKQQVAASQEYRKKAS
jgi:uncharacterized RDD family membrane protein YckC